MKRLIKFVSAPMVVAVGIVGFGTSHVSADDNWQDEDMARARLISSQTATNNEKTVLLGFQIELKKGWKTYWRTPGDSGLPPVFEWAGSQNIETAKIKWPRPDGFDSFGLHTWGYSDEILLPIQISVKDPEKPLTANLKVSYGVCEKVCVPIQQEFSVHLKAQQSEQTEHSSIIAQYEDRVPKSLTESTSVNHLRITEQGENLIHVLAHSKTAFSNPDIILEGENGDFFEVRNVQLSGDGLSVVFGIGVDAVDRSAPLAGRKLTVTLLDKNIAIEDSRIIE